jgi:beta-galactosidase beta subunit
MQKENSMLEHENAFYEAHKAEFHEKYLDKWLVIAGDELFGAFDTIKDAFLAAQEHFGDKDFMLHRPADDGIVLELGPVIQYAEDNRQHEPEAAITVADGDLVAFPYV